LLIKNLCLPPVEDPEEEVKELAKIIESEKSTSVKGDITKFPILPSSSSTFKLETNKISWASLLYRNFKFSNIFYNRKGNPDFLMIFSSIAFVITLGYFLFPKMFIISKEFSNFKKEL
jgi:hypothetical protein